MDEIGQDPKLNVGFPRGRWLDVAVTVALIAAAVLAVMTARGGRPAAAPGPDPAWRRPRRCCQQRCGRGSRCRSASPAA
jgi:hypothetical protein